MGGSSSKGIVMSALPPNDAARRTLLRTAAQGSLGMALATGLSGMAGLAQAGAAGALSADALPAVLKEVRTRHLMTMRLDVRPLQVIGSTPGGMRRIGVVPGGEFQGERLAGAVLDGGNDWQSVRLDGSTTLDVRLALKTGDGALIAMSYRGIRHGPADVIARVEKGEAVDPASYYFRILPLFETAAPHYEWLNRVVAVGMGQRRADGVVYNVFEVL
jgi:hypothetical protein